MQLSAWRLLLPTNKPTIFVVGNAPTALMKLYEMYQAGLYKPAFIIGVPVGFVNVVEAKEEIMETDIPYIINKGRKRWKQCGSSYLQCSSL